MLFNSYIFIFVFLPIVLDGWWDWRFVPLMWISAGIDWFAGQKIASSEDPKYRKTWLAVSMTVDLAILGFFKYYGFFATSVNQVAGRMGMVGLVPVLSVVLPIGISFYTFNSMSYTIDIYRRIVKPAKSVLHFSAFVAMFPHLVSGPI